ncbi:MAG: hypothetical protein RSA57_05975 [Cetobacterium sp.]|uniref:hypothetical protein n=1 Tax=Cetobacterium sp. TaxID=2071632 RepID=UPI002FC99674
MKRVLEYIKNSSKVGELVSKSELLKGSLEIEAPEIEKLLAEILSSEESSDIKELIGMTDSFYYSTDYMSDAYAEVIFKLKDENIEKTISDYIRKESKIYPRPTALEVFKLNPFKKNDQELEEIFKRIEASDEFKDIQKILASNGAVYLYSDIHMTKGHARGLCEWVEVGQFENP